MMNAHVIKMIQHDGTDLTQKYIRGQICDEEFFSGVLVFQERLKQESRSIVGGVLHIDEDCKCWDPMFNNLKSTTRNKK